MQVCVDKNSPAYNYVNDVNKLVTFYLAIKPYLIWTDFDAKDLGVKNTAVHTTLAAEC